MVMGAGPCAYPAGPLLPAGGGADAGCRAARRVARCRARCPASEPAPVITPNGADAASAPVPACTARPSVPPIRMLFDYGQPPAMVTNLISRRAGHSGLSGGGRRGA